MDDNRFTDMGIGIPSSVFIKSIQSGVSAVAGSATITAVDTTKTLVLSESKAAAGYASIAGTSLGSIGNNVSGSGSPFSYIAYNPTLSGGTTNVVAKEFSAVLTNATTVTYDGAVEWQALEFGNAVKSVQRGVAAAAGDITITAVDITKTVIFSKSKGSAGTVAGRGTWSISMLRNGSGTYTVNDSTSTPTVSGGTTDLTVKHYSAKLKNSTQITVDGPCEYQIVEFK